MSLLHYKLFCLIMLNVLVSSYQQSDSNLVINPDQQGEVLLARPDSPFIYQNGWTEERILNIAPPNRPNPSEYMPQEYITQHLKKFIYGGSKIITTAWLDINGRQFLGDSAGQFIIPKKQMDSLLAKANGELDYIERNLGIPSGAWKDRKLSRVDINFPDQHNLRMPSGNERSSNQYWRPGGVLSNGLFEAVIDAVPQIGYQEFPLDLK